jgi:hypothetical protein
LQPTAINFAFHFIDVKIILFFFGIPQKKFGTIKKIGSSLQPQNKNMQSIQSHIETGNRFSPKGDYPMAGQVLLQE